MLRFLAFNFGLECCGSDSGAEERGESEEDIVMSFDLVFRFRSDTDLVEGSKASSSSSEDSSITSLDRRVIFEFRPRVSETVRIASAAWGFAFLERIFARSAMLDGISILKLEKFEAPIACT